MEVWADVVTLAKVYDVVMRRESSFRLEILSTVRIVTFPIATEFATPPAFECTRQFSVTFPIALSRSLSFSLLVKFEMGAEVVKRGKSPTVARLMYACRGVGGAYMGLKASPSLEIDGITACSGETVWVRTCIALVFVCLQMPP